VWVRACRDIEAGEELLASYPPPFGQTWEECVEMEFAYMNSGKKGLNFGT